MPTTCPAWRVRLNGDPGLESRGSSRLLPTCVSPRLRSLSFGATIPSWPIPQLGLRTRGVVRRPRRVSMNRARGSLIEQQQYLACPCLHCATALTELADDRESKSLLIEAHGARHIAHVQRGFKDAIGFGAHRVLRLVI